MPFTLAHPAVVLPIYRCLRGPGLVSAVVIGSMAPDFVYWWPWTVYRDSSHSIPALFSFCLPASFSVFWLYHLLIKPPLLALLPQAIFVRLPPLQPPSWHLRNVVLVLLALLLGAITHIIWDGFTHHDTLVTQLLPFLDAPLPIRSRYTLRVHQVLQHGSTLVGLSALALFSWRWYQCTPSRQDITARDLTTWQKTVLVACLIVPSMIGAIQSGLYRARWETSLPALRTFLEAGVVTGIGIFSTVLVILGLLWPWVERGEE